MKNRILMIVVIIVVVLNSSCTQEKKWNMAINKAKKDFTVVLTRDIVEKTIDEFLVTEPKGYGDDLSSLNWYARYNFLKAQTNWDDNQYWWAAYATFTAWDNKLPINSYTKWYFEKAGVDESLAKPFIDLRTAMLSIAKKYLANPENLNGAYLFHKPMLMEKFKDHTDLLIEGSIKLSVFLDPIAKGSGLSDYDLKFFERRKAEGGEELLQEYCKILDDLIDAIEHG